MGAMTFFQEGRGANAQDAFTSAVQHAQWEHGHGGYSGTLAEKHEYTIIPLPAGEDPRDFAERLIEEGDDRIDDKWGPAGCIEMGDGKYLFFGWASS